MDLKGHFVLLNRQEIMFGFQKEGHIVLCHHFVHLCWFDIYNMATHQKMAPWGSVRRTDQDFWYRNVKAVKSLNLWCKL